MKARKPGVQCFKTSTNKYLFKDVLILNLIFHQYPFNWPRIAENDQNRQNY